MQLALTEGDADRIENLWISAQPRDVQDEIWAVYDGFESDTATTTFLDAAFVVPYLLGDPLVETIVARDGLDALDAMLRYGAGSTERRLHRVRHAVDRSDRPDHARRRACRRVVADGYPPRRRAGPLPRARNDRRLGRRESSSELDWERVFDEHQSLVDADVCASP
jgi:hypothetical protein